MTRDINEVERYIQEHPLAAHLYAAGFTLFVLALAMLIEQGLIWISRQLPH